MAIVFRADASLTIGNGHVMRCLSIAKNLRAHGAHCSFVCASLEGNLNSLIKAEGFEVFVVDPSFPDSARDPERLIQDWKRDAQSTLSSIQHLQIDWMVVDHYGLDWQWEKDLLQHASHLMVLDDLANRMHQCHVLVDPNPGRLPSEYFDLIPNQSKALTGSNYTLIREAIFNSRPPLQAARIQRDILSVLISMGGVDKDNLTSQVLESLNNYASAVPLHIQVILGPLAPWKEKVNALAPLSHWPTIVWQDPQNLGELMGYHDIAIGAAGTSALERCFLGLPSINLVLAPNQLRGAKVLQDLGAASAITLHQHWQHDLHRDLRALTAQPQLAAMKKNCLAVTDGLGIARITQEMVRA